MATILVYTSPARGHLFPILGTALELHARGHKIHVKTLSAEIDRVRSLGLSAERIAPEIEAREMDDWRGRNPMQALEYSMKTFGDRAFHEINDLQQAVADSGADALIVDTNSWGAQAAAEASGLPWSVFQPYFTALPAPGVPPFGPGLARSTSLPGRIRDSLLGRVILSKMDGVALPAINASRGRMGLDPIESIAVLPLRPPRLLYFTAGALEYPRDRWPDNFRFVGPGTWAPAATSPDWLAEIDRPIALVTCSSERQRDRSIVETALAVLPDEGLFVVATGAAYEPGDFAANPGPHARLERFIPHDPVVRRAGVVVCHGGMGITQRSLSHGVPVVVIPFGRDQMEVARRVEYAGAGVRLLPKHLNRKTLAAAVRSARSMTDGAGRIAAAFAQAGGASAAADAVEELAEDRNRRTAPGPAKLGA